VKSKKPPFQAAFSCPKLYVVITGPLAIQSLAK